MTRLTSRYPDLRALTTSCLLHSLFLFERHNRTNVPFDTAGTIVSDLCPDSKGVSVHAAASYSLNHFEDPIKDRPIRLINQNDTTGGRSTAQLGTYTYFRCYEGDAACEQLHGYNWIPLHHRANDPKIDLVGMTVKLFRIIWSPKLNVR